MPSTYWLSVDDAAIKFGVSPLLGEAMRHYAEEVLPFAVYYQIALLVYPEVSRRISRAWRKYNQRKAQETGFKVNKKFKMEMSDTETETEERKSFLVDDMFDENYQPVQKTKIKKTKPDTREKKIIDWLIIHGTLVAGYLAMEIIKSFKAEADPNFYGAQEARGYGIPMWLLDLLKLAPVLAPIGLIPDLVTTQKKSISSERARKAFNIAFRLTVSMFPGMWGLVFLPFPFKTLLSPIALFPNVLLNGLLTSSVIYPTIFREMQDQFGYKGMDLLANHTVSLPWRKENTTITPIWRDGFYTNNEYERYYPRWMDTVDSIGSLFKPFGKSATSFSKEDLKPLLLDTPNFAPPFTQGPRWTYLGHSTCLMQIPVNETNAVNVLFDPALGYVPPSFKFSVPLSTVVSGLPKIDEVVLSHNHADHDNPFQMPGIALANPYAHIIVGKGGAPLVKSFGFRRPAIEMSWWQTVPYYVGDRCLFKIHMVPSKHASQTNSNDNNKALWGSYIVEVINEDKESTFFYFVGDTALGKDMTDRQGNFQSLFSQIAKYFPKIDFVAMPTGPDSFYLTHMDYKQAVQALSVLRSNGTDSPPPHMMPIHWGIYYGEKYKLDEQIGKFIGLSAEDEALNGRIHPMRIGASFTQDDFLNETWQRSHYIDADFYKPYSHNVTLPLDVNVFSRQVFPLGTGESPVTTQSQLTGVFGATFTVGVGALFGLLLLKMWFGSHDAPETLLPRDKTVLRSIKNKREDFQTSLEALQASCLVQVPALKTILEDLMALHTAIQTNVSATLENDQISPSQLEALRTQYDRFTLGLDQLEKHRSTLETWAVEAEKLNEVRAIRYSAFFDTLSYRVESEQSTSTTGFWGALSRLGGVTNHLFQTQCPAPPRGYTV